MVMEGNAKTFDMYISFRIIMNDNLRTELDWLVLIIHCDTNWL